MTKWKIEPSFKYDALCFLNIMTADSFYLTYHQDEYDKFKTKLTPEAVKALAVLHKKFKEDNGKIVSATLCLYFSSVEDSTLSGMIQTLENPLVLQSNFKKTMYYDEENWQLFLSLSGELKTIFKWMDDIDFYFYWKNEVLPKVNKKISETEPDLFKYDVIRENEYFLGFKLSFEEITIYMLYYTRPHGIRITGTRFITDIAWPFEIVIRTAAHEMMHPPYDYENDIELKNAIDSFKDDKFLMDKVLNHNPSFGYNSLLGLIEEDCVQALDQLINENFGIAIEAHKRWKESVDGIHVMAIALYQVMKEENYNSGNLKFRDFFLNKIKEGKLSAGKIKDYYDKFYGLE